MMTAIIVAGRSGSAFAAEIGTMVVNEEVDALTTMGFHPFRFLAIPKVFGAAIVVPLLTLYAIVFGILGGLIVGRDWSGYHPYHLYSGILSWSRCVGCDYESHQSAYLCFHRFQHRLPARFSGERRRRGSGRGNDICGGHFYLLDHCS